MFQETYDQDYLDFYDPCRCIGDLGEKWCNFKWHIYNVNLNPKDALLSPVFTTRLLPKSLWYLEVKLSSPGDEQTLGVSLNRIRSHENIPLIIDVIYKIAGDGEIKMSEKMVIKCNDESALNGIISFNISLSKQKKDYLTVECKLRPNKKMVQNVLHGELDDNFFIPLRWLLLTSELFDTIIRVGEYRLVAHIAILHCRLPKLLQKGLAPNKEDGKHIVYINDLPLYVVKQMLKYAYTGQAYVDVESSPISKDIYLSYSESFYQSCCWEDHPSATTSLNYETDSLSWSLKDTFDKSNLGTQNIDFLGVYPSKITFSLDVGESAKKDKCLMLKLEFLNSEMPKPIVLSCKSFLVNSDSNETLELTEKEFLLKCNTTKGEMIVCSFLTLEEICESLDTTLNSLILKTDFKFCCGSYKSSVENLYEGHFDISKCTSCPQLSVDMNFLYHEAGYYDIILESSDGRRFKLHKAILIAKWPEATRHEVKTKDYIVINEFGFEIMYDLFLKLYKGTD